MVDGKEIEVSLDGLTDYLAALDDRLSRTLSISCCGRPLKFVVCVERDHIAVDVRPECSIPGDQSLLRELIGDEF